MPSMPKTRRAVALVGLISFMLSACEKKMDCDKSIEAYCADPTLQWTCTWSEPCPWDYSSCASIVLGACGPYNTMYRYAGTGFSTKWHYEKSTGALVAVVDCGNSPLGAKEPLACWCTAGPSDGFEECE